MSWHKSEYQNSVLRFYFRVAICLIVLFSLGCSGLQQQHKLPQAPLSCLLPLFLYSFFFSFFFFFSSFSFSFSFPFSLSVVYFILVFIFKRKWEEGSKYLQTVLVYTMTTAHSVFHSDVWFGHIIEQSLTLSPGELRESTKSGKTLLISLQQNWRVV